MEILKEKDAVILNNLRWYVINVIHNKNKLFIVYQLNNPVGGTIFITHNKLVLCLSNNHKLEKTILDAGDVVTRNNKTYEIIDKIYNHPNNLLYVENLGWYEEKSFINNKLKDNVKPIKQIQIQMHKENDKIGYVHTHFNEYDMYTQASTTISNCDVDNDIDNKANEETILIKECLTISELSDFIDNKIQLKKDKKLKHNLITWCDDGKNWQTNKIEDFFLLMLQKYGKIIKRNK